MSKRSKILTVLILFILILVIGVKLLRSQGSLSKIHTAIEASYNNVEHISAIEFEALDPAQTIVFDVREPDEFQVSHLANAILLTPDTDMEDFIEDFGEQINGKRVVFYCSVGRRSSEFLSRLHNDPEADSLLDSGAGSYNLEGGVFAWANSERELVDAEQQATLKVHPFNAFWGQLINDSATKQY